nr:phage tail tape measure protein [Streptomyces sp. N502]
MTVGELTGIITIDDRAVNPALRRAENALRASGQRMGDEADRAGQQAGQQLGDGIVRGADGRLRNARGQFVAAGRRAGDALGDGLSDAAADGADDAVEQTESRLAGLKVAAAAAGLAAGAVMMDAFGQALEQSQITGRLGAQLGATPAEAQRYGKLAGELYADAVTADFQSAADAISAVMRAGIAPPDATNTQLKQIATNVSDLASTFELDLGQTANAVGQILKTGLAKDGVQAVDALTAGLQQMGPRADDIADTFNEYSTIFRQMGIDVTQATGLLSQGMKAGARDTDVIADSLKEFVLITQGGGEEVDEAFKKIGLSGKEMQKAFVEGGPQARSALDKVFDGLRGMKNETDRNAVALELFGTKSEDTQKALLALDPSAAANALGQVGGAADKMGDSLRDNAGANLTRFKNTAQQTLVDFMGGQVIPALIQFGKWLKNNEDTVKAVAATITGVLGVAFTFMTINATKAAIASVRAWFMTGTGAGAAAARHVAAAGTVVASWLRMAAVATAQGARIAAVAVASAARTAAAWVASAARMTATWLVSMLRVAATTIAQFALMAARAVAWAAVMAAQWLIAMGPIGWVIAAVVGLVAVIIANWDTVKRWTGKIWDWVMSKIAGAVGRILGAVRFLRQIPGWVSGWFGQMRDLAIRKALEMLAWLQGLPRRAYQVLSALASYLRSRAASAGAALVTATTRKLTEAINWIKGLPRRAASALGNLGSVLASAGRSLIQGFIDGIKGMFGSVKSTLGGLTSSLTSWKGPESLDKRLLTPAGRLLIEGFQKGINLQTPALRKQLQGLTGDLSTMVGAPRVAPASGQTVTDRRTYYQNSYTFTARPMTMQDFEAFQRRQDALARVGRPR